VRTKTLRPTDGPPVVTDGPLAEAKEHFGGYLIVDCETNERAVEIAAKWPSARFAPIERRPILDVGGAAVSLHRSSPRSDVASRTDEAGSGSQSQHLNARHTMSTIREVSICETNTTPSFRSYRRPHAGRFRAPGTPG
jgi:hypothetical protein